MITADRLKRFNEKRGTVAGTTLDEIAALEAEQAAGDEPAVNFAADEEEGGNGDAEPELNDREEEADEVVSM